MSITKSTRLFFMAAVISISGVHADAKTYTSELFDTVIEGGRVMDPETNFDAIANIGIRRGKIKRITNQPLKGKRRIDANGLVVAPGFIDIHSHILPGIDDGAKDNKESLKIIDGLYEIWNEERLQ